MPLIDGLRGAGFGGYTVLNPVPQSVFSLYQDENEKSPLCFK